MEIGLPRWVGDTREERLNNPSVINLLKQSKLGKHVFALITFGTIFQIIGTLWQAAGT